MVTWQMPPPENPLYEFIRGWPVAIFNKPPRIAYGLLKTSGSNRTGIDFDNTVLIPWCGGGMSREVVLHGIQIHSAAQ
jgi:hypothetical protein